MSRKTIFFLPVLTLTLFACNLTTPVTSVPPTAAPLNTAVPPTATGVVIVPTSNPIPTSTSVPVPSATAVPPTLIPTAVVVPVSIPASPNYIDDRTDPWQVIVSYYNAISRQEYSRAYGYWNDPANMLGNFTTFANGYADTASVDLVFGPIDAGAGMNQVYYAVPVILKVTNTNTSHVNYAACYMVHSTNAGVYGAPPVDPMIIVQGGATPSDLNAPDASVLATACASYPSGGMIMMVTPSNADISASNFIDNRSGPVETVSSLLNALNLKQYARAYGYYTDGALFPGPYDPWAAGYADTGSITVTFGTPTSEGAAGSTYWKLPTALKALSTTNTLQTFVGCYTLRLVQPGIQVAPPFKPLGIVSGKFKLVSNNADINSLLPNACK
jgi:hypothetical protein